jgi:hypothetical protein
VESRSRVADERILANRRLQVQQHGVLLLVDL